MVAVGEGTSDEVFAGAACGTEDEEGQMARLRHGGHGVMSWENDVVEI